MGRGESGDGGIAPSVTRRILLAPLLSGVWVAACAPLAGPAEPALGPVGWRRARAAYGPDPRQVVQLYRPARARGLPLLLLLPQAGITEAEQAWAEGMAGQGMVVALADRRPSPVPRFPAYISDTARALAWAVHQAPALGASPDRVAVMGQGEGGRAALMLALDRRYLASVGMAGRLRAVVALDVPDQADPTFTDPGTHGGGRPGVPIWRGPSSDFGPALNALKQTLI